jgi:cytochrome c553
MNAVSLAIFSAKVTPPPRKTFSMKTALSLCTLLLVINLIDPRSAICEPSLQQGRLRHTSINGNTLFQKLCADCHGSDGHGSERATLLSPPITDIATPPFPRSSDRDAIIRVIRNGLGSSMLSYGSRLSDAQITAIADHVLRLRDAPLVQH